MSEQQTHRDLDKPADVCALMYLRSTGKNPVKEELTPSCEYARENAVVPRPGLANCGAGKRIAKEKSKMEKYANTEVRIPLYDRSWDNLEDVFATLAHIGQELRLERDKADLILIEIEWEQAAKEDEAFMALVEQYSPEQFWLRFERR